jgi:hypothetical protein
MVSCSQSPAIIFARGLFGLYGLGHLAVSEEGVEVRWSGLVRVRPKRTPWSDLQWVRMRGSKVSVKPVGQLVPTTAFVFRQRCIREALERCGPSDKVEV